MASLHLAIAEWFKAKGDERTAAQLVGDAEAVLADSPLAEKLFHHYLRGIRGRWLAEQGRTQEAEGLLRGAADGPVQLVGPDHHAARGAIDALAELYEQTGQPTKATEVRAKYHQQ